MASVADRSIAPAVIPHFITMRPSALVRTVPSALIWAITALATSGASSADSSGLGIAVTAARHEIIGRKAIDLALIEWRVADLDRDDTVSGGAARVGLDGQARDLGETPAGIGQLRKPVLEGAAQIGAGDLDGEDAVVERQFGEYIARGQRRARRIDLAAPDPAAIRHRRLGVCGRAHRVGPAAVDSGLPA